MAEDDRRQHLAGTLRDVLEEGEAYNVYCHEGEVYVNDAETSVCAVRHPRLYGRLLSLSTRIEEAGAGLGRIPTLLLLIFCVGIHLRWWDDWLGPQLVAQLDSFWFFLLLFFALFQVVGIVSRALQRVVYQGGRDELFALMAPENLDRDLLLALIEGDEAVARAGYYLKLDRAAPEAPPPDVPR